MVEAPTYLYTYPPTWWLHPGGASYWMGVRSTGVAAQFQRL